MEEKEINKDINSEEVQEKDSELAELRDELDKVTMERNDYLAGWQRAKADFVNYKKDEVMRLGEIVQYSNEDIIKELIDILDAFDLALRIKEGRGPDPEADKAAEGIKRLHAKTSDILRKRGLTEIIIEPGDEFDPATAEAMIEIESAEPPGKIHQVLTKGYRLHDKVLRAAKVAIAKEKEEN